MTDKQESAGPFGASTGDRRYRSSTHFTIRITSNRSDHNNALVIKPC